METNRARRRWALASGLVAGVLVVAFFVFLALSDDGGGTASSPATDIPSPTIEPISPTPAVSPTPDLYGVPVRDLALGEPVAFPAGVVMYYTWANIEGPSNNLWRAYRTASGELKMEDLFKRVPEGQPFTTAFDFEHGRLAVGVCIQSYCGGYGSAMPDSKAVLVTSEDGGATWTVGPALPVGTFLVGYTERGLLTGHSTSDSIDGVTYRFEPSGEPLTPLAGAYPYVSDDGRLLFEDQQGVVSDESRHLVYQPPVLDVEVPPRLLVRRAPWSWSRWTDQETANSGAEYWGERDGIRFTRVLRWRGPYLGLIAQLDADHFLGRLDSGPAGLTARQPVLVDVAAASIHPLSDIVDPGKYFHPYQVVAGTYTAARPGSGECLNVREAASGTSATVTCVAEGVLLKVLAGAPVAADGVPWVQVALLDGRSGWVSAAFIEP